MLNRKYIGSAFDNFLKEQEIFAETVLKAIKKVLIWKIILSANKLLELAKKISINL